MRTPTRPERPSGFVDVSVSTSTIERVAPLRKPDYDSLYEAIFRDTWGERLRRFLSKADFSQLSRLCDPQSPEFALARPDFHFLQTFTVATGTRS